VEFPGPANPALAAVRGSQSGSQPRQTRTGSLSAVEDAPTKTTAEPAAGIETRLAEAVVEPSSDEGDRDHPLVTSVPPDRSLTMARRVHGEGSTFQTPDGSWHALINLGTGLDGTRVRRRVRGRTQGEVRRKLDELEKAHRRYESTAKAGRSGNGRRG
jgi:hypothetical protein